jgi:hypothetical protein
VHVKLALVFHREGDSAVAIRSGAARRCVRLPLLLSCILLVALLPVRWIARPGCARSGEWWDLVLRILLLLLVFCILVLFACGKLRAPPEVVAREPRTSEFGDGGRQTGGSEVGV